MLYIHIENDCNGALRPVLLGWACSRCSKLIANPEWAAQIGWIKKWYTGDSPKDALKKPESKEAKQ